jgi:hypothetical protein
MWQRTSSFEVAMMSNQSPRIIKRSVWHASGPLVALVVALVGCSQGPVCRELASCGGDPMDKWAGLPRGEETPGTYCQELMHTPPQEAHLRDQLLPVARQRLPEKNTADWCSELTVTGDMKEPLKKNNYWWEDLPYIAGFLEYMPDGTYRANMTRKAFVDRWFSQVCLRKYGYGGDCKQFQADLEKANQGAGEYNTFNCNENAKRGGCDCNFEIFEVNTLLGSYSRVGDTITHFPASPTAHFSQASFCVNGDKLQISGKNNSFLWDRPGLRTIEMVRMNCNDGKAGPGELGVDCGLGCPNPCPQPPP